MFLYFLCGLLLGVPPDYGRFGVRGGQIPAIFIAAAGADADVLAFSRHIYNTVSAAVGTFRPSMNSSWRDCWKRQNVDHQPTAGQFLGSTSLPPSKFHRKWHANSVTPKENLVTRTNATNTLTHSHSANRGQSVTPQCRRFREVSTFCRRGHSQVTTTAAGDDDDDDVRPTDRLSRKLPAGYLDGNQRPALGRTQFLDHGPPKRFLFPAGAPSPRRSIKKKRTHNSHTSSRLSSKVQLRCWLWPLSSNY